MGLFNIFKKKRNEAKAVQCNSENAKPSTDVNSSKNSILNTKNEAKAVQCNSENAKPSIDVNSSKNSILNTKSVANQGIRGSNPIFPIAKYSEKAKKVFIERDDPHLVHVFTYDEWINLDAGEEHYLCIYFYKKTKKWVYGYKVSTIPGLASSAGWGFCEQYEISYDFVEEILKIRSFDEKILKKIQAVMNNEI